MELQNITNNNAKDKIIHQIDNEGCKCHLCQKIIMSQIRTIKKSVVHDLESEVTKGQREEFFSNFLTQFYFIDKMARKIKLIIPEVCVFDKGTPISIMSKKRETLPMKLIKNKEKLNAFEIHNFFMEGFVFHNNLKENNSIGRDGRFKHLKLQHYNFDEALKNECIVLTKFINGTCQMMTPLQLTNLFKSKQRALRNQILYINTMVCSSNYNEIKIHLNISSIYNHPYFERAKNQVKMINQDIKPKDFLYLPEREERGYEDKLKQFDSKQYLEYISLKLALLYSLRTDVLFYDSLFKYIKDQSQCFYLVDVQVYKKASAAKFWGYFGNPEKQTKSPTKERQRPASSPQRLQRKQVSKQDLDKIDDGALKMPRDSPTKNIKQINVNGRIKTSMNFKLQPIVVKKNTHL